ncbi:MAG: hypothetical protein JEZ04_01775 [Spirochaetales bacterium]|nr:hypothetical protein [Spirochaetales bacterium]
MFVNVKFFREINYAVSTSALPLKVAVGETAEVMLTFRVQAVFPLQGF